MDTATLDDLMALNEQLAALVAAGVQVDIGFENRDTPGQLAKINAIVARRVSRGESLAGALADNQTGISPTYRRMLQVAVRSGQLSTPLAATTELGETVDYSRNTLRLAFLYPLLVCLLAYVGLVVFCLYFVPTLKDMAESLQVKPGPGLSLLESLSKSLPYWVAIPPILLAVVFGSWWTRNRRNRLNGGFAPAMAWLPTASRAVQDERCAIFAETLSKLVEDGVLLEEGLPLAAGASGDAALSNGAQALAEGLAAGQPPSDDGRAAMSFPPFLRWALWHAQESVGLEEALRMAVGIYQKSARRRSERLRLVVPALMCVLVGGGATLLYGLALFVPVVELLQSLGK